MGPALLLAQEIDFAYRTAAVKDDWARSRPVRRSGPRTAPARRALAQLRGRTVRLLHV
jgi:hypothetical protein